MSSSQAAGRGFDHHVGLLWEPLPDFWPEANAEVHSLRLQTVAVDETSTARVRHAIFYDDYYFFNNCQRMAFL